MVTVTELVNSIALVEFLKILNVTHFTCCKLIDD